MMERRGLLVQAASLLLLCGVQHGASIPLGDPLSTTTDINLHSTNTNIKSYRSLAFGDDSQCVLTGGDVPDGDCRTSDDGCCDLFVECRDDGICQLAPPVCTADSTCDGVDDICARGVACVSPDNVDIVFYPPGSSPYQGVVRYESQEFFFVGTGDIPSGSYSLNEIVTFDEDVGANVHVAVDGSGRLLSFYAEGNEDEVITFVYDDNGNLVSGVEADGGNGRALAMLPRSTTAVLQDGSRRLVLFLAFLALPKVAQIAVVVTVLLIAIADAPGTPEPMSAPPTPAPPTAPPTTAPPTPMPTPPAPTPTPTPSGPTPAPAPICPPGDDACGDPHMQGLCGQRIDWSGVDGGWYSMIKDDNAGLYVNVRLTAPLPDEFPDRQLMTSLAVLSDGHSVVIEVENPYTIETDGCPEGVSPCLANGGLRMIVDGQELDELIRFSRQVPVADGAMTVSSSNLPVECRQFGGDRIWAHMYQEMLDGRRQLRGGESLEEWILRYDHGMAAPGWCAKYIAENDLADLQSTHAIFKIETPTVVIRLNAGVNYQGNGELNWDGRVLPDLEFWQMDVGMNGLDVDNPVLSGLLGETARPVYDENGKPVMEGSDAFRGTVEDYRVSGALGVHFPLLDEKE